MIIRDYKLSDKKQVIIMISEILGGIFNGNPAQFKVLKEFEVTKGYIKYLVAEVKSEYDENKIIATMALKKIDDESVRLKRMYVHPNYRRRGLAQKMLDKLVKFAKEKGYKKILLHTYPIMEHAQKFYKRNGFVDSTGDDPEQIHVEKIL